MKKSYILLFLLFTNLVFAQTEQISLNFFAENLLPKIKKIKVFYDGKVLNKAEYEMPKSSIDEETIIENILWDYNLCKNNRRGLSNKDVDFYENLDFVEILKFANVKNSHAEALTIPKSIVFVKSLKTKNIKSGKIRYKIKKLFSEKYNLKISPSIQLTDKIYLTRIFLSKQDFEKGSFYDIIVQNNQVVDWLETGWVQ